MGNAYKGARQMACLYKQTRASRSSHAERFGVLRGHPIWGVHTETCSELVGPNRFTKIGFDDLLAFTLLIRNRLKLHMFAHMLSTTETMEPFLVVCALLWAKMMLSHRFRVRPSCRHLFGISR